MREAIRDSKQAEPMWAVVRGVTCCTRNEVLIKVLGSIIVVDPSFMGRLTLKMKQPPLTSRRQSTLFDLSPILSCPLGLTIDI